VRSNQPFERVTIVAAIGGGLVTLAAAALFRVLYSDCSELECLGVVLFVPVAAIGAAVIGLVAGGQAEQGGRGYARGLLAAGFGVLAALALIRALSPLIR
jgi:hypothetical protein